jgi:hypothetical protein
MRVSRLLGGILFGFLLPAQLRPAYSSPVVASAVSSWTYNSGTQLYTYSYVVTNAANSPHYLETFGIHPTVRPVSMSAPSGWSVFRGWQGDTTAVVWAVSDLGPDPPNWTGNLYIGLNHMAPGTSKSGFQIVSTQPPDSTGSSVGQGFDTIPGGAHTFGGVKPPALKSLWQEGWVGSAIIPANGYVVGVRPPKNFMQVRFYPPVPNPTQGSVDLTFFQPRPGNVVLSVYDVAGRKLADALHERRGAGPNRVTWKGRGNTGERVVSGVYFYRLMFEGKDVADRQVVVLP